MNAYRENVAKVNPAVLTTADLACLLSALMEGSRSTWPPRGGRSCDLLACVRRRGHSARTMATSVGLFRLSEIGQRPSISSRSLAFSSWERSASISTTALIEEKPILS